MPRRGAKCGPVLMVHKLPNCAVQRRQSASEIKQLLSRQVVGSVLWEASIRQMMSDGIEKFEEIGTGRILRGTLQRIHSKLPSDGFGDAP